MYGETTQMSHHHVGLSSSTKIDRVIDVICYHYKKFKEKGQGEEELILVTFVFLSCIRSTWQAQGQHTSEFSISTQARQLALKKKNVALRKSKIKLMSTNLEIAQFKGRVRKHAIEKANWRSEDAAKPAKKNCLKEVTHQVR